MYEPPNASKDSMHSIVEKTQINRLEEKFNSFLKFRITNSVLDFKIRMSTKVSVQVDACGDLQLKQFQLETFKRLQKIPRERSATNYEIKTVQL